MTMANVIDISEYQDPAKFDYQAAKSNGIKAVIIRLSVGNRRDNHAAEHIANCKKYGLKWHGYHYWYNLSGEAAFAISDAQSLGLTSSQYFFLDMEDKTLSSDWSAQFESFRSAVGGKYKIGLYCSDSPYKSHFDNAKMVAEGVYRWIAAYSYEPANYDTWQMSGEGSGGFGSYTGDVDRDYDKTGNLLKEEAQPITPSTTPLYRQIIGEAGYDTDSGIYGLGRSYDNGKTFHVMDTVYGRIYRQQDGDSIWPFIVDKVKAVLDWSNITNKPDVALKSDVAAVSAVASNAISTANQAKSTADSVNNRLNYFVTSGRNYIRNSESIIMTPNGTNYYDLVWYVYDDAFASNTYCHGNNKTRLSFYLKPSKALPTARTFRIYWRASPWNSFGTITVPANTTDTQYYELAMTTPTSQPIASQIFIRFMKQDTSDISYTITYSMLTIGDSFPDWQPAPEDIQSEIDANSVLIKNNTTEIGNAKTAAANAQSTADSALSKANSNATALNNKLSPDGQFLFNNNDGDNMWALIKSKIGTIKGDKGDAGKDGQTWQPYIADDKHWHIRLINNVDMPAIVGVITQGDANDLTMDDSYRIDGTVTNVPSTSGLLTIRANSNEVWQTYIDSATADCYTRTRHNGTWTAWRLTTQWS